MRYHLIIYSHGLYGGDEFSAKAAANELRGLVAYYKSQVPGLHVPLMSLVIIFNLKP